ncbi:MAG: aldehyde dehydrogenase family protein, partial [Methyloligellaceae bacterium]
MSYEKLELLIGGEWKNGGASTTEPVINPATEEVLAELPHASPEDLDSALQAALDGFKVWRAKTALERQAVIAKAADLIEASKEDIARTLTQEMGKPIVEARIEIDFVAAVARWYGEEGKRAYGRLVPPRLPGARQMVVKEPVGPAAAFVAWNFPGVNVIRKVAGALGAGCSIIIKPSEETPGTAVAIARCFQEAGAPPGVVNVVFGVPDEVSRHVLASPI